MRWHGQQKLSPPRNDPMLRNLKFVGWFQECWTSKLPRMCCLLRPFLIRFLLHASRFHLPSRVSCVRIQTCTTRKLVIGRMLVWNRKYPLLLSLVFLWLAHSDFSCRESLKISSAPELEFWESWPWWFHPHPSCHFYQERYPAYLLIARAPVMPSRMPPFLLLPKNCQTAFLWMDHCRRLRPEFFSNGWESMHLPGVNKCVDRFVKLLEERKPMLHSITGIEISCLCMIVLVFVRLSSSSTDEEALIIICVRSCSGNPLLFSSVAVCCGARRRNFIAHSLTQ